MKATKDVSAENVIAGWLGQPFYRESKKPVPKISKKRSYSVSQKTERRERNRVLNNQKKSAAIRAKYGPQRKPAPVVVKSLDGEVTSVVDQDRFAKRSYSDFIEAKAKACGYASYDAFLRSPKWLSIRERVLARDRYRCRECGARKDLVVHHDHYNLPLDSDVIKYLKALCTQCHHRIHR